MRVDKLSHRLAAYRYFYTTKEPLEGNHFFIHKKGCPLLTDNHQKRLFIGFERLPSQALQQAQAKYPEKVFILCKVCSELSDV